MIHTFSVLNVKCGGCAHTLRTRLREAFGEVAVDLSVHPRQITLEIEPERIEALRQELKKLGYPVEGEVLNTAEKIGTTIKSFTSCAVGKAAIRREQ